MSVQATTPTRRVASTRRRSRAALRVVLLVGFAVLALLTLVGVAYGGAESRIAQGVTVEGVDIGGLTPVEARVLLERRAAAVERVPITFVAAGTSRRLSASQLGIRVDWAGAVDRAHARGEGFRPLRGIRRLAIRLLGAEIEPRSSSFESVVAYTVGELGDRVDRPAREPALRRVGLRVSLVPGRDGVSLARRQADALVVRSLAGFARGAPVVLPVIARSPRLSAGDLSGGLRRARVALSGPVVLTAGPTRVRLGRPDIARILRLPSGGATDVAIAGPGADRWLARLQRLVNRAPRDATFAVRPGGIEIVPARDGRTLDMADAVERVLRAATSPTRRVVALPLETAHATRSTADARGMGITGVVGSYTTTYGGTPGRLANVKLVAELIDGTLVAPGATFSFNRTTGERTAARGFQEAPVIIDGEVSTGIGGGVCQVSTTVFNAAFEAGLPIGARTNHALYISHYPLGRDATVDYPDIDLTFSNDTSHWLLLRTFVGAGSLTVNLYGEPQHRRVESETQPLTVTGKVPVERTPDPTLAKGKRVVEEQGTPPRATRVVRRVFDADGTLLYESSWASTYRAEPRLVRVGTKAAKPVDAPPPGVPGRLVSPAPAQPALP